MATLAFVTGPSYSDVPEQKILGLTLVHRLVRQLIKLQTVDQVWIDALTIHPESSASLLDEATPRTSVVVAKNFKNLVLTENDSCLLLDSRTLIDDRILCCLSGSDIDPVSGPTSSSSSFDNPHTWTPGVVSGDQLSAENGFASVSDAMRTMPKADLTSLSTYMENRRRHVTILLHHVETDDDIREGSRLLVDAAQKGVLDWPAWFIHRPLENGLTLLLSRFPITPNQVTVLTGFLGFYAAILFAQGQFLLALSSALLVGVLDGVDGKLARVKLLTSKAGEFEHVLDKLVEYAWYLGLAYYFSSTASHPGPMIMAAALILFLIADEIQCEFFRRMSGKQICDASSFDRSFRLIGGRRNTHMWTLVPFVLMDFVFEGFAMICIYGVATFFVHQARFVINSKRILEESSETLRETFRTTKVI